jgi:hypothetical protein
MAKRIGGNVKRVTNVTKLKREDFCNPCNPLNFVMF